MVTRTLERGMTNNLTACLSFHISDMASKIFSNVSLEINSISLINYCPS